MNHSAHARSTTSRIRISGLPTSATRRLTVIGLGWMLAALIESAAYTVLAISIRDRGSVAIVLTVALVSVMTTVLISRAGYLDGARLAGDLYAGIGRGLASAKLSWFTAEHRAVVTNAAGRGVPSLMAVPAHQLQTLICTPLIPAFLVGAVAFVSGTIAVPLALLLVLALLGQMCAQRRLQRADSQRSALEQTATQSTLELVNHLELLRTAAGPVRSIDRAVEVWTRQEEAMARTNHAAASATFISALARVVPLAGVIVILAATGGFAEPLAALATIILTARASAPLDDLALAGVTINELRAQVADYRRVVEAPRLAYADYHSRLEGNTIDLRDVVGSSMQSKITENIPEGARIHVAGASGSGKSTLLGLLMRFDDPVHGSITLGGVPLSDLTEAEIAAKISYVPQHAVVFTGTLGENIKVGRPDASDAEVLEAAHRAQLDTVIAASPLGLDQTVGVRGQGLSGGERQRVAIARALLKGAPVVILDEATSALDEATEARIAETLSRMSSTLFVVTHRDPTVWNLERKINL